MQAAHPPHCSQTLRSPSLSPLFLEDIQESMPRQHETPKPPCSEAQRFLGKGFQGSSVDQPLNDGPTAGVNSPEELRSSQKRSEALVLENDFEVSLGWLQDEGEHEGDKEDEEKETKVVAVDWSSAFSLWKEKGKEAVVVLEVAVSLSRNFYYCAALDSTILNGSLTEQTDLSLQLFI